MAAKKPKAKLIELSAPYDLKTERDTRRAADFETEYGIAWMSDEKLEHRRQKQGATISNISSTHYTRCVLINKGSGWSVAEATCVRNHLLSVSSANHIPSVPNSRKLTLEKWLKDRRQELESLILKACHESPEFAAIWATEADAARTGAGLNINEIKSQHAYMIRSIRMAFSELADVERSGRKYQKMQMGNIAIDRCHPGGHLAGVAAAINTARRNATYTDADPAFLEGVKAGFYAGKTLQGLRAEFANEKAMKMASQTAAGKRPDKRTTWLAQQISELEKKLERKAKTPEIIKHIENQRDPISGEPIWFVLRSGDDEKVLQWSERDVMTLKTFRDKVSHIRKSQKK